MAIRVDVSRQRPTTNGAAVFPQRRSAHSSATAATRLELRCPGCGFGAIAAEPVARCPMCGRGDWQLIRTLAADPDARPGRS